MHPLNRWRARLDSRLPAALRVLAAWTVIGLLFMLYVMLPSPAAGDPWEWARATGWQLTTWWSWALWTPVVVGVTRRAVAIGSPYRRIALHLAVGVAVAGVCAALQGSLQWAMFSGVRARYDIAGASSMALADQWSFNLVVYGMVVGIFYALRAGRLEAQLDKARLDVLTARLRPHFLFNALNTISALVIEDPKAANRMITRLSELLRHAFDRGGSDAGVTLDEELRLIDDYVAIQETRFGDRLRVVFRIEPGAGPAGIPPLLLQPLVENAITHGLAARGTVTVSVEARRDGDRLRLVVRDNGPGFSASKDRKGGIGLASTRARLNDAYGRAHRLELANAPSGGAVVTIELPFKS